MREYLQPFGRRRGPPEGADGDADVTDEERSSSRGLVPRSFSTSEGPSTHILKKNNVLVSFA